ncbi:MAG: FecR domain-containing protein [Candidatus Omnitrophica bacterium]|nr:FecR domain-containing protein [Candidatus Omnitrophota bacterium]
MKRHPSPEEISRWLDQEVPRETGLSMESHMGECARCLMEAEKLNAVRKHLRRAGAVVDSLRFEEIRATLEKVKGRSWLGSPAWALPIPRFVWIPLASAAVLALFFLFTPMPGMEPRVAMVHGNAWIAKAEQSTWERVSGGETLRAGSRIRIVEGSEVDVAVKNRYELRLKGGTLFTVKSLKRRGPAGHMVYELNRGTLLVKTEKEFKGSTLLVETPSAKAKALGTAFAVQVSEAVVPVTWLGVLQGRVEVEGFQPSAGLKREGRVLVGEGQSTHVRLNGMPTQPETILEEDWALLTELYHLGSYPQVAILVSPTARRVRELLRPAGIYITDREPHAFPDALKEAVSWAEKGIATRDPAAHEKAVSMLKEIADKDPESDYQSSLLLFIGAYAYYLDNLPDAVESFGKVVSREGPSGLSSLALCAVGLIEEEQGDYDGARETFWKILEEYPGSLEQEEARRGIERLDERLKK